MTPEVPKFQPVQTPLGQAYPPPVVQQLIADLENVQKRMTELKMRIDGLPFTPKKNREMRRQEFESQMTALNAELLDLQQKMNKHPLKPEHFKHPARWITECCKEYVLPPDEVSADNIAEVKCPSCESDTTAYRRMDREKEESEEQKPEEPDSDRPFLAYA